MIVGLNSMIDYSTGSTAISSFSCTVDYRVTQKSFKFARNNHLPFYFVSAADGTNVVKVRVCVVCVYVCMRVHVHACVCVCVYIYMSCMRGTVYRHISAGVS